MNRRAFLSTIAAATLDPERLLWEPGKKKIFIPPAVAPPNWEHLLHVIGFTTPVEYFEGDIFTLTVNGAERMRYRAVRVEKSLNFYSVQVVKARYCIKAVGMGELC